jgi:imidazoleglycerol-phosphate dehydratase
MTEQATVDGGATGHRTAAIRRSTSESSVELTLDLDGTGESDISTGVRFYDHMLASLAKHSLVDLQIKAVGDVDVDAHHTVEDVAIVLGDAFREALGDKRGISRFGDATVPLDEALVQAVVDVAGRPYCVHTGSRRARSTSSSAAPMRGSLTRHVFEDAGAPRGDRPAHPVLGGRDPHHVVEAQFKAVARALRAAVAIDPRGDRHTQRQGHPLEVALREPPAGHPPRARRPRLRRLLGRERRRPARRRARGRPVDPRCCRPGRRRPYAAPTTTS